MASYQKMRASLRTVRIIKLFLLDLLQVPFKPWETKLSLKLSWKSMTRIKISFVRCLILKSCRAGVPLVPGYHGSEQSPEKLFEEAKKVGFPVLFKAALGGGGKGMKIAYSESECQEALLSAQREAKSSFGDERVLLERYVGQPRHIEVQVDAFQYYPTISFLLTRHSAGFR